jgi:pseudouridine kinase
VVVLLSTVSCQGAHSDAYPDCCRRRPGNSRRLYRVGLDRPYVRRVSDSGLSPVRCLGGAIVDRVLRPINGSLVAGSSNPVTARFSAGGVARNIAGQLAGLGVPVLLHSIVGDDVGGRLVLEQSSRAGIDCSNVTVVADASTAEYIAVLTDGGDLSIGLVDAASFDRLDARWVRSALAEACLGDWVVVETNLTADGISEAVAQSLRHGFRLAVDPVSVAKSARLPVDLHGVEVLMCNTDEAAAMTQSADGPVPVAAMAVELVRRGATTVVVTSKRGATVATVNGVASVAAPTHAAPVIDVTGAGDAAFAATLASLRRGDPAVAAVAHGQEAAATVIARLGS